MLLVLRLVLDFCFEYGLFADFARQSGPLSGPNPRRHLEREDAGIQLVPDHLSDCRVHDASAVRMLRVGASDDESVATCMHQCPNGKILSA
jgi:hypothetical protein